MMDLWTLIVVNMFQSFWMAVIAVAFLMWIIFVVSGVSQVTSLNFLSIFIMAMAIGYGFSLISIGITVVLLLVHLVAIPRMLNS